MITIKLDHEIIQHFPNGVYSKEGVIVDVGYYTMEREEDCTVEVGYYTSYKYVVWC